jgi:hypothetical protein
MSNLLGITFEPSLVQPSANQRNPTHTFFKGNAMSKTQVSPTGSAISPSVLQWSAFPAFYNTVFLAEHTEPTNVALHVLGTVAGLTFVPAVWLMGWPWLALMFPVVHAAPGLLGHRFLERNLEVGDVRVTRTDYSPLWFIAANHRMTWELITRGFYWRN